MLDESFQLVATGIALEEQRRDDRYQKSRRGDRLVQPFLPILTEFDAVNILENG
jgi:hypothetical protein